MMRDWKLPWGGECRCSRVRFEVTAPPILASACHCSGCQKMTASAYSTSLAFPAEGFKVTKGEPVLGGLQGASKHYFCPFCKSWMFTRPEGLDWLVNVRATMLDDHSWFVPFVELCTDEGFAWAKTPARHSYGSYPEEQRFMEIAQEFAAEGAGPP
jgi:hypothetical protein